MKIINKNWDFLKVRLSFDNNNIILNMIIERGDSLITPLNGDYEVVSAWNGDLRENEPKSE